MAMTAPTSATTDATRNAVFIPLTNVAWLTSATALLARREGVDPTDQRPWLLAAMFGSLLFLANREWNSEGHGTVEAMLATFDAYADGLNPSLFGHW
jgi:hypothetical protein